MNYLIVPAWSDQAGQCRIVSRPGPLLADALSNYRAAPDSWKECGIMSSKGSVVALLAPHSHYQEFRAAEPLMAGTSFYMEDL